MPGRFTYTYPAPAGSRPHALTSVAITGASTGTDSYTYDPAGNTLTRNLAGKPGQTLTWDPEGHLATLVDTSGTASYTYTADGARLIGRDANGTTTAYLDGQELKTTGGTPTCTRFYGDTAVRTTTGLTWMAPDHHGTGELAVTATTLAATRRRLDPYGNPRAATPPTWVTTRGFVNGTADPTTLTHLGAREYEPNAGRFISVDPILQVTDPQQFNGYSYANNNPTSLSDPMGLCTFSDGDFCIAGPGKFQITTDGTARDISGTVRRSNDGCGGPWCASTAAKNARPSRDGGKTRFGPGGSVTTTKLKNGTVVTDYGDGKTYAINGYVLPLPTSDPYRLARAADDQMPNYSGANDELFQTLEALGAACDTGKAGCTQALRSAIVNDSVAYLRMKQGKASPVGGIGIADAAAAGALGIAGAELEWQFKTSKGTVTALADVEIRGDTMIIRNVLVYGADGEIGRKALGPGGHAEIFRAVRAFAYLAAREGYSSVSIEGIRLTGGAKGRVVTLNVNTANGAISRGSRK